VRLAQDARYDDTMAQQSKRIEVRVSDYYVILVQSIHSIVVDVFAWNMSVAAKDGSRCKLCKHIT
jgi:hypothetical protein